LAQDTLPESAEPDWDAIALDYAASALTVEAICAAHRITQSRLYRRARRDGWPMRSERSRGHGRSKAQRAEADLVARLLAALDAKMKQYESRLGKTSRAASSADAERDARTLSTLVRLAERLKSLAANHGGPPGKRGGKSAALGFPPASTRWKDAHDADRLRGELARRLEILRGQLGG
jgi:hypothetical protein